MVELIRGVPQGARMAKRPDAFLSYTRFDDQHERGKISEFRKRLADAVRAVTGEPFEIFQDVDDIAVGERWSGKLEKMIDEAPLFIPILTPSYFRSQPCRDELEKFLVAEKAKGRDDLVLPIYYIECDVLEDPALRAVDPLAAEIYQRQRYDWRKLWYSSFGTAMVRRALEELARDVAGAHRRLIQPTPTPPLHTATRIATGVTPLKPGTVFRDIEEPWCPEMVVIPPGEFMMGSTAAEKESPQHLVRIAYPLAVGRYPVTFEEYGYFARSTGRAQPGDEGWGRGRRPVINVDWEDAKAFAAWLSVQTRQRYRLPSEAEWEYACRAGTTTRHWWGDEITPEKANYGKNRGTTSEVGSYPVNPFGLYDTQGNVWEWVEDRWHDSYNGAPDDGSAWTAGNDPRRVVRGGSWGNSRTVLRSSVRVRYDANDRRGGVGFRLARTYP
jgi:formylglycine-generating enzyme required for sulfatase activity